MSQHTHTHNHFTSPWILSGTTGVSWYQKKHSPTQSIVVISHPLSASSIYYDPWHPPGSIYVPDSLFPQFLYKFSLVYLLVWHPQLHTRYISSPNQPSCHTITTCFAVVLRLVSLSTLYLELCLVA